MMLWRGSWDLLLLGWRRFNLTRRLWMLSCGFLLGGRRVNFLRGL